MTHKIAGAPSTPIYVDAFAPDLMFGKTLHIDIQLSATPGTETIVAIPEWANYVKIYPVTYNIVFAVSQTPVAGTTSGSSNITVANMFAGDIAVANLWEIRSIFNVKGHIQFASATANVVVHVVFVGS